jgi:hypothetical protein
MVTDGRPPPWCSLPVRKFIGGLPMNAPTNRLAGSPYTTAGVSHWMTRPWFITAMRSPRLSASTWSWVT